MSTDPRSKLKNILIGVTATIDDGVTAANILVIYGGGPENLKYLFNVTDYDVVITLERWDERRSPHPKQVLSSPLRYNRFVPVSVSAIDKTGVTATKVLTKVRDSIINRVESFGSGWGNDFVWYMEENTGIPQYIGGVENMWIDTYRFLYRKAKD